MHKSWILRLLILACGVIVPCVADAQVTKQTDFTMFRVGLKSISIPSPSIELPEMGSDYRVILDALSPTTNRLVAAFLLPEEFKALLNGPTNLSRYALVEVPRTAEFATITPETFRQIVGTFGQEFDATIDGKLKEAQDEYNRKLKALSVNPPTLTLDKPVMLGSLFSKPDAFGVGGIIPVGVNGKKNNMVMAVSVVRVQERVLYFYLYTAYIDQESVNWARATSEKWTDAILAGNK